MPDPTPPAAPRPCECGHDESQHGGIGPGSPCTAYYMRELPGKRHPNLCACMSYRPVSPEAAPNLLTRVLIAEAEQWDAEHPSPLAEAAPPRATTPGTPAVCEQPMTIHNYADREGWTTGICGLPMPCKVHGLDDEWFAALQEAVRLGRFFEPQEGAVLVAAVASLRERAEAAERERDALVAYRERVEGLPEGTIPRLASSPSRESEALVQAVVDAVYEGAYSFGAGRGSSAVRPKIIAARAELDARLSTLERDAARMREQVRDYQARMMGAGALLCEPVSSKNLREAKAFLNPAYHDAAEAYRAARALTPSGEPTTTPETSDNGE